MRPRPLTPERKKHVMRCIGVLDPRQIYTREGLMRFAGIGSDVLKQARASGVVKPINIGRRCYYLGAEVVRWIESQARRMSDGNDANGNDAA